ncbi:MAG: FAD binding domain-containing protein [Betaproteobacteria bacterium]
MKAAAFRYVKPTSLAEVFDLLERHGDDARILAGGQSLIAALNMRLAAPAVLIDINALTALEGVTVTGNTVRIGALARHRTLERSAEVARHVPLISQAVPYIAHPAIRNRGTFGGSIAFADPAAELPACSVALGATFVLVSARGERHVPARDFFTGLYDTALKPGELLVAGEFPAAPKPGYKCVFFELARRRGDYAITGIAAQCRQDGGVLRDVSVAFLGVGATPILAATLAGAIEGRSCTLGLLEDVESAVRQDVAPDNDLYQKTATKLHLSCVIARRAVSRLFDRGEQA